MLGYTIPADPLLFFSVDISLTYYKTFFQATKDMAKHYELAEALIYR